MVRGLSAPARPSRFWVGRRPRPGRGRTPVRPGGPSIGGGGYTSPASPPPPQWHHEARSRISPVPALTSRQRRRILSHAIWRARRSPAHCGGRGRGQRAGAHPGAKRKRQVPLPQRPWRSRWGRGLGKGGGRCSRAPGGAPGARASEGLEEAPPGQCQSVPPASSPSTAPARSSGPGGSPSCPSPTPQEETGLPSPVHPAREAPGEPCLAEARGWTPGSDPPAP